MCLLFKKPAAATLTDAQLEDMYSRNQDGYGVMYAVNHTLHIDKGIGSVQDWIAFFRKYEHLEACFHLRMRTHGDIDLTNTHPYPVWGFDDTKGMGKTPIAMMHNGILSTGNYKDKTKSDTWHYIRDWVRPLSLNDQSVLFTPQMIDLMGEHIGTGNKFAIMDAYGHIAIVNESAGVRWNGMWFSNTYAWSPRDSKLYPGLNLPTYTYSGYGAPKAWELDDDERYTNYWNGHANVPSDPRKPVTTETKTTTNAVTITKNGKTHTLVKNADGSTTTYPGTNIHRLPNKTKPNAAGKGKKRRNNRPITSQPALDNNLSERDEEVIGAVVSSMFKDDVNYLRGRVQATAKYLSDGITTKMLEDNISKFGVEVLDEMLDAYQDGHFYGMEIIAAYGNHEAMKLLVNELLDLDPENPKAKGEADEAADATKH